MREERLATGRTLRVVQYRICIRSLMRFAIGLLRLRGRILPWREVMNQEAQIGDLRVEECLDEVLHRYVRTARLLDPGKIVYQEKAPELLDVRLVGMSPLVFTLTGIERIGGVEYAQSWIVSGLPAA
jgi:hypothetical protein